MPRKNKLSLQAQREVYIVKLNFEDVNVNLKLDNSFWNLADGNG